MRWRVAFFLSLSLTAAVDAVAAQAVATPAAAQQLRMIYMAQAGYSPSDVQRRAEEFRALTGINVELTFAEYEDQYSLIMHSADMAEGAYDIILLDLIWTAEFAERGLIDPVPPDLSREVRGNIVPEIYSAFDYGGALWAVPFLANFKLLFTNMGILERAGFHDPPSTLEEMVDMASAARRRGVIEFPVFLPLRKQEALVCEFVWLTGAFGGDLYDHSGAIDVTTSGAEEALAFLVDLLDRGLLNPYSLQSEEVFAAEVFTAGDALFAPNWVFLGRLIDESELPIRETGRAGLIPTARSVARRGADTTTVSGYQGLSVTHNSVNKETAWRFVRFLSSPEFQRRHLEEMPVWREVWDEETTLREDPDIGLKRRQIGGVHHRPIHPAYRDMSNRLQYWIYEALRGNVDPPVALQNAQREIDQLVK